MVAVVELTVFLVPLVDVVVVVGWEFVPSDSTSPRECDRSINMLIRIDGTH